MTSTFSGSGVGTQTPDGCSVELYRQLPDLGELGDIAAALQGRSAALELGCGTGRLCRRLLELGLAVAGVDESSAMLAHLPKGVEAFESSIEGLRLGRRWPVVLLPSQLINHPLENVRRDFLRAARRHLEPHGSLFIKRHDPAWLASVQVGPLTAAGAVGVAALRVARRGSEVEMTLRYEGFGQVWTHSFTTAALSESQIEGLAREEGFVHVQWHGDRRLWAEAVAGPER